MRHYISSAHRNEINENFNLGLKTPTLGGYPYQITPLKMLEMYNALFTQNRNYHAGIAKQTSAFLPWQADSSWQGTSFTGFLCNNIFEGMRRVITSGTATQLNGLRASFPDLYFYAKTGTINEESSGAASSRRLILTITDKDMTKTENINHTAKVYSIYFVIDNNRDFDWNLLTDIAQTCIHSRTFKNYFGRL
jgi:cell division protein FtsI/penicillin-binding protein 2